MKKLVIIGILLAIYSPISFSQTEKTIIKLSYTRHEVDGFDRIQMANGKPLLVCWYVNTRYDLSGHRYSIGKDTLRIDSSEPVFSENPGYPNVCPKTIDISKKLW